MSELDQLHAIHRVLRKIENLLRERLPRPKRLSCSSFAGPNGDYETMLNLKPGQTGTAIFTFQDNTQTPPVSYPLAGAAQFSVDDTTKASFTMLKDGTSDGIATATITPVPGASPGPFNVICLGHGEADGTDDITGTLACAILAHDDNSVVATSTVP